MIAIPVSGIRKRISWTLAIAGVVLTIAGAQAASSSQVLSGHVLKVTRRLQATGQLPDTNRLHISIVLPLRNQAGLQALLQQIYDPSSPNYRKFLTPEQFAKQFGPAKEDYQSVVNFAKDNGLKVVSTSPNRTRLTLDVTAGDVRNLLHVNLLTYKHPTENRSFYAPDAEPTIGLKDTDSSHRWA